MSRVCFFWVRHAACVCFWVGSVIERRGRSRSVCPMSVASKQPSRRLGCGKMAVFVRFRGLVEIYTTLPTSVSLRSPAPPREGPLFYYSLPRKRFFSLSLIGGPFLLLAPSWEGDSGGGRRPRWCLCHFRCFTLHCPPQALRAGPSSGGPRVGFCEI